MDFDQLTTFVQVAKLKSFSQGGAKSVSFAIRRERANPPVGAGLSCQAPGSLGEIRGADARGRSACSNLRSGCCACETNPCRWWPIAAMWCRARSSFGANEATCLYLLPDILSEFQRRYPLVHISIYRNFSHKILQRLEDGSLDLGIVTLPLKSPNLKMHIINRDRLRFFVSSKNPLAQRSHVTLDEIAAAPLIFPKTGYTRQVLDKLFRPHRSRLRITMELPSIGMIKTFVAADVGISIISESFARDQVKTGDVKLLNVEGVDLYRELALVYRRDRSLPRAVQALIAMIRESRKLQESAAS